MGYTAPLPRPRPGAGARLLNWLIRLVCLVALLVVGWTVLNAAYPNNPLAEVARAYRILRPGAEIGPSPFGAQRTLTLLLFGVDERRKDKDPGRADTIIVAMVNLDTKRGAMISLPRDALMADVGLGDSKLNEVYARARSPQAGTARLRMAIEELTGLTVDRAVKVNFQGIVQLVDGMGGVWIDVPKNMDYEDKWDNLYIHLKKGYQRLNGQQAMGYVRFRHDPEGDVGRMRRQREFLTAAYQQLVQKRSLTGLVDFAAAARRWIYTDDFRLDEMAWLLKYMRDANLAPVERQTFPTRPRMLPREGQDVYFEVPMLDAGRKMIAQAQEHLTLPLLVASGEIKVEVRNGSGLKERAAKIADGLRLLGFTVSGETNEKQKFPKTKVFAVASAQKVANQLAEALGFPENRVFSKTAPQDAPAITVVLGADVDALLAKSTLWR